MISLKTSRPSRYSEFADDIKSEYEIQKLVYSNDSTKASKTPFDTLFGTPFVCRDSCHQLLEAIIKEESLQSARQELLVEYMLQRGAPVNARTQAGITPLFSAVGRGSLVLTKLLLKHGADPNIAADGGCTPLILAAWDGEQSLINALVASGADLDAQLDQVEPDNCTCVQFVSWSHVTHDSCYAPLSALAVAAKRGYHDAVGSLLDHGAEPNLPIEHHAHGKLLTRRERRRVGRFNSTESSDTDPEPDPHRWEGIFSIGTALTWARGDIRELLLRHGADPTKEVALRRCNCPVIEEKGIQSLWMSSSDLEYQTSEGYNTGEDLL